MQVSRVVPWTLFRNSPKTAGPTEMAVAIEAQHPYLIVKQAPAYNLWCSFTDPRQGGLSV